MKNQHRILSLIIIFFSIILCASYFEASSATKKTKAKTTTVSKKKNTKSTTKRKTTTKRKSSTKKSTKKTNTSDQKKKEEVPQNDPLTLLINEGVIGWIPESLNPGGLRVNSVVPQKSSSIAKISLNENFTYLPVTRDLINDLTHHVKSLLPDSLSNYDISLQVGDKPLSYFITTIDKLPESARKNIQFVVAAEPFVKPNHGMEGDIVAMWPSHGRYFKTGSSSWQWQRPQLFQVTEDTHTMSYILPYVVPMLENAGAYVLLPRERDINRNEVIVDNDTNDDGEIYSQPYYREMTGTQKWITGELEGFIYDLPDFRDTENPFENGTYRQTTTVTSGKPSVAAWYADIPEDGEYAVYVSYKTLPDSSDDALYTVNYSGGSKKFKVNQQMGGGTWIYLGTFPLEAGFSEEEPIVTLSNISSSAGKIITADAVKIGGGMGNIARSDSRYDVYVDPSLSEEDLAAVSATDPELKTIIEAASQAAKNGYNPSFMTSGLPRYLEGARYWLQWAGMPESVYSPYHGTDDYKDDYTSRGLWVNYLAGGSRVLPDTPGLNIPVDVTMALHSDAGKKADDSFIGTLGIYFTNNGDYYKDGTPRTNSRALTDLLMRQITLDIRQTWEPQWTRRAMWDKTYVEARVPEVPTSLIEFMSHQNYADMMYALDPAFRFSVSRSIYKAIGRFISERKDRKFIVQPLPVKDFFIRREKKGVYKLQWSPAQDPLEPTANPTKYIILERSGDELGFHKLGETTSTNFSIKVKDNDIHSFKIIAANEGGLSFPSEILAFREGEKNSNPVLIINGFTRISAPANFSNSDEAGFKSELDFGVPYIRDISFIGYQTEFKRNAGESFGKSAGNYADMVIAGNTFDYPYIHGLSFAANGKGFVSSSLGAVLEGKVDIDDYKIIDLILGKQKTTVTGNGASGIRFTAFPEKLQRQISNYIKQGGNLLVSGAYVASDLEDYRSDSGSRNFENEILGISIGEGQRTYSGNISLISSALGSRANLNRIPYSNTLNESSYIVENPDILSPSKTKNSQVFLQYSDTQLPAGIITSNNKSKTAVMSIPLESIDSDSRTHLLKEIINYFEN